MMALRPSPVLSIIIISYNVRQELTHCLDSLEALYREGMIEVHVIDNASSDGSHEWVVRHYPWVTARRNARNIGFAAAVNQGIASTAGALLLLLNPDTVVCPGAIEYMIAFMNTHPDCGIAGGQLLNPDHSPQESCRDFPTPGSLIAESLFLKRAASRLPRSAQPVEVDAVVGACLMIRRGVIQDIGLLDEIFFLYSEEVDWCLRARKQGWKVYLLPEAEVTHGLGKSAEFLPGAGFVELYRSRSLYMRKHFSIIGRWLAHAGMFTGVLLRVILWNALLPLGWMSAGRSSQVRVKVRQNQTVLLWYLKGCPNTIGVRRL